MENDSVSCDLRRNIQLDFHISLTHVLRKKNSQQCTTQPFPETSHPKKMPGNLLTCREHQQQWNIEHYSLRKPECYWKKLSRRLSICRATIFLFAYSAGWKMMRHEHSFMSSSYRTSSKSTWWAGSSVVIDIRLSISQRKSFPRQHASDVTMNCQLIMGGGVACVMRAAESAAGALHKYFKLFSFHLTCKNIPRFNESE